MRNNIEQFVGIRDIGDLEEFDDNEFGMVDSYSESVGLDLLQLVHNKFVICIMANYQQNKWLLIHHQFMKFYWLKYTLFFKYVVSIVKITSASVGRVDGSSENISTLDDSSINQLSI